MKAVLLAIGAGLCWGIGELFTKSVLHTKDVGPVTAITIRSTVALPVLWIAYLITIYHFGAEPREWFRQATPATITRLVVGSGLIAGAAAMILFYAALNLGEVSRIKPIAFALAPATAVLLGWLILGESMTPRKAIGVALILTGVILLTGNSKAQQNTNAPATSAQLE